MENLPVKISWQAPEHEYHKKTPEWFWVLGIITTSLIFAAVIMANFLFAVIILLSGFIIALYGARVPKTVTFEATPRGIATPKKLYDYDSIGHFWLEFDPPHQKELMLEFKKTFSPHLNIMLGDADPDILRSYLLQYIKEKKIDETFAATLARILKF